MSVIGSSILAGASGAAGGGDKVYVDDVFSTFLWTGTGSAQTITNGIDLAGEGGLVWSKNRDASASHLLNDSARGIESGSYYSELVSNTSGGNERFTPWGATAFNSNGFSLGGSNSQFNLSGNDYASWIFRKAPGFFDIVTYTGTGSARTVAHNLGSVPGMIICKPTSTTGVWRVYHQNVGNDKELVLSSTQAQSGSSAWNDTTPTSTEFTVNNNDVNASGVSYIAYIFAHDDASFGTDGDESIIKCGGFTATNTWGNFKVDLGFEPQFVLFKRTDSSGDWIMLDSMRGIVGPGDYPLSDTSTFFSAVQTSDDAELKANESDAEGTQGRASLYSQGFLGSTGVGGGATYIYMAIRRPNKPPEAGTEVFAVDTRGGTSPTPPTYYSGFPVDWFLGRETAANDWTVKTRLTGNNTLSTVYNSAESSSTSTYYTFDQSKGLGENTNVSSTHYGWMFKRAPGFFDVVAYAGTLSSSGSQTVPHNLTVTPELIIVKRRSGSTQWYVYSNALTTPLTQKLILNDSGDESNSLDAWGASGSPTAPNANNFTVGYNQGYNGTGSSGSTYIAYLFATLPGISKVGSYTGTGSANNIDCGFTAGARFVLIKRTDASGDWFVFDTARGIVSGNDFFLKLNSTSAQAGGDDYIDPYAAGFTINGTYSGLNASGGTYIFLAIA